MSLPGWYPDPAGTPNRFRYWDGQVWSTDTTDKPATTPPVGSGAPSPPQRGRRRAGPLILVLTVLVVAVLAGVLAVRGLVADRPRVDPGPLPSSTVSGWDDSSPAPEPETPTPAPSATEPAPSTTPTPAPEPTEELPVQPCPEGQPLARQDHPTDDRIHGGGLSFPKLPGWEESSGAAQSWAYDVGAQLKLVEPPTWYASLTVGALFTGDGFDEPKRSADLVLQCVITSRLYPHLTERQDIWSKAVTVDGRPGWSVRADLRVDDPALETEGDTVDVIVVDTDSPESLAMFIGAVDIGDAALLDALNTTIQDLRVE